MRAREKRRGARERGIKRKWRFLFPSPSLRAFLARPIFSSLFPFLAPVTQADGSLVSPYGVVRHCGALHTVCKCCYGNKRHAIPHYGIRTTRLITHDRQNWAPDQDNHKTDISVYKTQDKAVIFFDLQRNHIHGYGTSLV